MNKKLFGFCLLSLFLSCRPKPIVPENKQIVFEQNFEASPLGLLSISQINKDFNNPEFLWGYKDRILFYLGLNGQKPEIVNDHSRCLKTIIPESIAGPIPGQQWSLKFDSSFNELNFIFKVKFDSNFCFVNGGKLPGLAGGKANTGGKKPNGLDGWSARLMFWKEGKLCFWLYHKNQNGQFGDTLFFKNGESYFTFERNKWYTIKQHIIINDLHKKNGVIEGYINDSLMVQKKDITFSDSDKLKIDQFVFSVFLGGDNPSYASHKKEYIFFDDFLVCK
jgi:hypothetical protein